MKLTLNQLRRIIKEEVSIVARGSHRGRRLSEGTDPYELAEWMTEQLETTWARVEDYDGVLQEEVYEMQDNWDDAIAPELEKIMTKKKAGQERQIQMIEKVLLEFLPHHQTTGGNWLYGLCSQLFYKLHSDPDAAFRIPGTRYHG
jgi:hypothetical protein